MRPVGRTLLSYLLLPRPVDVTKWLFIPLATLVALLHADMGTVGRTSLLWASGAWLVFEYLIYQGRYQLNDIQGLGDDAAHPAAADRGRLPVGRSGPGFSVRVSLVVILVKVALAAVFVVLAPGAVAVPLGMSFVAVWVLAIAYEWLRAGEQRMRRLGPVIWIVVGGGYAIRTALGLLLVGAIPRGDALWSFTAFTLAAWLFGIVFVSLTWVLEASGHCLGRLPGVLVYPENSLSRKPHLIPLLRFAGIDVRPAGPGGSSLPSVEDERILRKSIPFLGPWNIALIAAVPLGAVAGVPADIRSWPLVAAVALVFAALTAVVTVTTGSVTRWTATGVVVVVVALFGFFLLRLLQGFVPAVVVTVFVLIYAGFREQSYGKLKNFIPDMKNLLGLIPRFVSGSLSRIFAVLVGRNTSRLLAQGDHE